jgi:hypothetical protein
MAGDSANTGEPDADCLRARLDDLPLTRGERGAALVCVKLGLEIGGVLRSMAAWIPRAPTHSRSQIPQGEVRSANRQ